jgi:hypothetical protein
MNKRKTIVLGLVLLLVIMPMVGVMMAPPVETSILNNTPFSPIKDYGISADPTIKAVPVITNADDTDNLYGGNYKAYTITVSITQAVGVAGIGEVIVTFNTTTDIICGMQYDNVTHAWTEYATNPTYITGTGTNITDANDFNATLTVYIDWTFPDTDNVYLWVKVWNATGTGSVTDQSTGTYDIDTELTMTPVSFIGLISTSVNDPIAIASTTISYADSGGDNYPLGAQTDFLLVRTPATGGTDSWSEVSYSDSTGIATWATVTAGYIAQKETFTMYAYKQGTTTTNLFYTSFTDSLELTNSGGAVYEAEPTLLTPQNILLGGLVVVFIILIYKWKYAKSAGAVKKRFNRSKSKGRKRK